MAFSKKTWVDRQVEHPGRRRLSSTGTTDVYDVTRDEGLVIEEGDALNAATFNDLENRVSLAFSESALKEVFTLSHSKSGTTHALAGLSGISGTVSAVFTATAAYAAGDTITVDGTPYTIQLSNGETAEDNLFVSGATVPIILDTGAKKVNFKAAGGAKLPAGTVSIVQTFLQDGTFTVPKTGKYQITVVGKGGNGADATYQMTGGSGGSGAWATSEILLAKDDVITITVSNAVSSFGSYLSATAGGSANNMNAGNGGVASNGNLMNVNGLNGKNGIPVDSGYNSSGTDGVPVAQPQESPFLTSVFGEKAKVGENAPAIVSVNFYNVFGCSGGGGSVKSGAIYSDGADGARGVVIVEFVA